MCEREIKRVSVSVSECEWVCVSLSECVCLCECVWVSVSECEWVWVSLSECVWVSECVYLCEWVWVCINVCVWLRERERVSVCVCAYDRRIWMTRLFSSLDRREIVYTCQDSRSQNPNENTVKPRFSLHANLAHFDFRSFWFYGVLFLKDPNPSEQLILWSYLAILPFAVLLFKNLVICRRLKRWLTVTRIILR